MTAPVRVVAGTVAFEARAPGYVPVRRQIVVAPGPLTRETVTFVPEPPNRRLLAGFGIGVGALAIASAGAGLGLYVAAGAHYPGAKMCVLLEPGRTTCSPWDVVDGAGTALLVVAAVAAAVDIVLWILCARGSCLGSSRAVIVPNGGDSGVGFTFP
jgi:hypothetical protein